ncbi:MAG: nuclear transport factor 2 family protein [Halioglobus sp.]
MSTALKPPFTQQSALEKVQRAEDLWNTKDAERVALAYTPDSQWRNRSEFVQGRDAIATLLTRKWTRELDYKLKKELFTYAGNRIAVNFQYEYHDDSGQWFRAYGNEHWEFDDEGLMHTRAASINEQAIDVSQRTL